MIFIIYLICPVLPSFCDSVLVISSFRNLSNENFLSHFSRELWGLEGWICTHMDNRWNIYTGIKLLLLIHPFISSFFFLCNFQTLKISSHFSQELWGLEGWNLVYTWTVGGWIVYTGIRLLLLIRPFLSSFFFLSNFQTLQIFVTLFSGTVRPRRLKLGAHVDNGWMYCVYRNQVLLLFHFVYFFIFLSLQFLNIELFHHTFLRNYEA